MEVLNCFEPNAVRLMRLAVMKSILEENFRQPVREKVGESSGKP